MKYSKLFEQYFPDMKEPNSSNEVSVRCPFHEDSRASMSINLATGLWLCNGCEAHGNAEKFVREYEYEYNMQVFSKQEAKEIVDELTKGQDNPVTEKEVEKEKKIISEDEINKWHKNLLGEDEVLKPFMEKRLLNLMTINKYKIGYDRIDSRYTIPVRDGNGDVVDVRKYAINISIRDEKDQMKMRAYKAGYGSNKLFPVKNMSSNTIVLCEGELDALLAEQEGFNAVTFTAGAGSSIHEFVNMFTGKDVVILYDNDDAGRKGAKAKADILKTIAASVKVITNLVDKKGGDVTDYFTDGGTCEGLESIIKDAERIGVKYVDYVDSTNTKYFDEVICFNAKILSIIGNAAIPKTIKIKCTPKSDKKCDNCVLSEEGEITKKADLLSSLPVKIFEEKEQERDNLITKHFNLSCRSVSIECSDYEPIKKIVIADNENANEQSPKAVYCYGDNLEEQRAYTFCGTTMESPRAKEGTINLLTKATPLTTEIDDFEYSEEMFNFTENTEDYFWKAIRTVGGIAKVYDRENLTAAVMLTFLTPIELNYRNISDNTCGQLYVIGDTGTGKSTIVKNLIKLTELGKSTDAAGVTKAGLLAHNEQVGGRWIAVPGALPINDKKLLHIDECTHITDEMMGELKDVITSGKVKIDKAASGIYNARVRMIMTSNTKYDEIINNDGINKFNEVVREASVRRRFDLAIAVKAFQYNDGYENEIKDLTKESLREIILYAWSRKARNIKIDKDTENKLRELGDKMVDEYVYDKFLIKPMEQDMKLAKYATAIAIFLGNVEGENVIVQPLHAELAYKLFCRIYDSEAMGLNRFSKILKKQIKKASKNDSDLIELLEKHDWLFDSIYIDSFGERSVIKEDYGITDAEYNDITKAVKRTMVLRRIGKNKFVQSHRFSEFRDVYEEYLFGGDIE